MGVNILSLANIKWKLHFLDNMCAKLINPHTLYTIEPIIIWKLEIYFDSCEGKLSHVLSYFVKPNLFWCFDLFPLYSFKSNLYSQLRYSTGEFQVLQSGCPWSVWCHGLTTCLLNVSPLFGNTALNNSGSVSLTKIFQLFNIPNLYCILRYWL